MNTTQEKIDAIRSWDLNNIHDLVGMISELTREERGIPAVENLFCELPSMQIPDYLSAGYPIWAIDQSGYALVGDSADQVEHISSIPRKNQK